MLNLTSADHHIDQKLCRPIVDIITRPSTLSCRFDNTGVVGQKGLEGIVIFRQTAAINFRQATFELWAFISIMPL